MKIGRGQHAETLKKKKQGLLKGSREESGKGRLPSLELETKEAKRRIKVLVDGK